jgi:uncharacterized protein (DUF736 family)
MSDYDNNNTGALFKNDKKQSDRHPDYNGSCEVNGVEMWMSSWIKTSKAGKKFMSFSFNPKDQPSAAQPTADTDDDNMPF